MWQMDADGRFALGSDEFTRLIGPRTAAGFGRLWSDIAETFGLDPEGRVVKAIATRHTWSGIILDWPVDGGSHLAVELSGLPVHDHARNYAGYRGFGVCRDLDGLARLDALRRQEFLNQECRTRNARRRRGGAGSPLPPTLPAFARRKAAGAPDVAASAATLESPTRPETSQPTDLETAWKPCGNAQGSAEGKRRAVPADQRTESAGAVAGGKQRLRRARPAIVGAARERERRAGRGGPSAAPEAALEPQAAAETPGKIAEQPSWLARPEPPARGETRRDRMLLDLLPVGVLIYRLDRLLYANAAFLERSAIRAFIPWSRPAVSTRSMSSPASPAPAAHRTPARR